MISSTGLKTKLFVAAVMVFLAIYCFVLNVQQEEREEVPAIEFSLSQAQYANDSNHFDRHIVVSNGPECAAIGL